MLRFFTPQPADEDIVDEAPSASWYDTLSAATGWLNPFNLTRAGASKTLFASLLFFKNMTTAVAASCFEIVGGDPLKILLQGKLNCHYTGQERRVMNHVYNDKSYNASTLPCDQYRVAMQDPITDSFWIGHGYFKPHYYSDETIACKYEFGYNRDNGYGDIEKNVLRTLESEIKNGWGSIFDFELTLGIAIPCAIAVIAAAYLTGFLLIRRSNWNKNRLRNNKYEGLTEALAENDIALLNNLKEMAIESQINLPKDMMFYILQQTKGYGDADYRKKYFSNAAHNPCPDDFVVTPEIGERAPIIRFCDSQAREKYRKKAFTQIWKRAKTEMWANVKLAEVVVDDPKQELLDDVDRMRVLS